MNRTQAMIERMELITQAAKEKREAKDLAMLNTTSGAQRFLRQQDAEVLDDIMTRISSAYNRDVMTGYKFDDNVEKMVAIASSLQFAKREVRELLEPSSAGDINLYELFDRDLRDMIISSYGSLPYLREPTVLEMTDGSIQVLDAEVCSQAETGNPADIETLNTAIDIISSKLGLYADYTVTETQEKAAWNSAMTRLNKAKQLQLLQGELSK